MDMDKLRMIEWKWKHWQTSNKQKNENEWMNEWMNATQGLPYTYDWQDQQINK